MGMRFQTSNVSSLYRSGSPQTVKKEFVKYMLDLLRVQKVRHDKQGAEKA
jgi:hypothetical protein